MLQLPDLGLEPLVLLPQLPDLSISWVTLHLPGESLLGLPDLPLHDLGLLHQLHRQVVSFRRLEVLGGDPDMVDATGDLVDLSRLRLELRPGLLATAPFPQCDEFPLRPGDPLTDLGSLLLWCVLHLELSLVGHEILQPPLEVPDLSFDLGARGFLPRSYFLPLRLLNEFCRLPGEPLGGIGPSSFGQGVGFLLHRLCLLPEIVGLERPYGGCHP